MVITTAIVLDGYTRDIVLVQGLEQNMEAAHSNGLRLHADGGSATTVRLWGYTFRRRN